MMKKILRILSKLTCVTAVLSVVDFIIVIIEFADDPNGSEQLFLRSLVCLLCFIASVLAGFTCDFMADNIKLYGALEEVKCCADEALDLILKAEQAEKVIIPEEEKHCFKFTPVPENWAESRYAETVIRSE